MAFTFDDRAGRYRGESGRFVTDQAVRDAVDRMADLSSQRIAALANRLQAGSISLADFQSGLMVEIKTAHIAAGVAAYGGAAEMSPSRWGYLGSRIKSEYEYARSFAAQIADGTQPLDGRLVARAQQYGQAARSTHAAVTGRERAAHGDTFERNVLGGKPCSGCLAESARGTVPIGTLVPIGQRSPCRVHCRCRISYSRAAEAEAA